MTQFDVVGLGVPVVDFLPLVDRFLWAGEVQRAREVAIQGGGPVATAMVTLAPLGARVAMFDALGDDWRRRISSWGSRSEGMTAIERIDLANSRG